MSFEEFLAKTRKNGLQFMSKQFREYVVANIRTKQELEKLRWDGELDFVPNKPTSLVSETGERRPLRPIVMRATITAVLHDMAVRRTWYGANAAGVTTGTLQKADGTMFQVTAVQVPGKDVAARFERVERPVRKRKKTVTRAAR